MTLTRVLLLSILLCAFGLTGCGQRGDSDGSSDSSEAPGVEFLLFPNSHASMGVGDYDVVITNPSLVSSISYTLTITSTDGNTQTFTGSLAANTASSPISFEQQHAGGVTITLNTGGATAKLELRNGGTTSLVPVNNGGSNPVTAANPSITLSKYDIDQTAYANAYYTVVDSANERDTLAKFKTKNGFNGTTCIPSGTLSPPNVYSAPVEIEVKFRDVHDLGYGRHMCVRRNAAGEIAVWVENFQVSAVPGQHYERLNLEALIANDYRWHIGTNAIEYSRVDSTIAESATNPKILKFYTFNPDGTRRTLVNLDGRGAKAMPVPCISCHGGRALPLTATGTFPRIGAFTAGNTLARMQLLNPDTFNFWDQSPWMRSDQEASIKAINRLVLCSYPIPSATAFTEDACRSTAVNNEWQGTSAELLKTLYGGDGMPNATAYDNYLPTGWTDGATAPYSGEVVPVGATNLYQNVVAPYCRVCHAQRGNNNYLANDIDFLEYQKFIGTSTFEGYAVGTTGQAGSNRIKHHVFDKGNMPLALLKWEQFWESSAPSILSAFVPNSTSGGSILQPTRPVAQPGPDRTMKTGTPIKLSAAESTNASSYAWTITGGSCTFSGGATTSTLIRPTLNASANGNCTIQLVVSNGSQTSSPATVTVAASNAITDPATLRFSDIKTILQDTTTLFCTSCHTPSNPSGPPIYYTDYDRNGDSVTNAADTHQFYLDVRARINFADIEQSYLLRRPSGHHHPGGLLTGFDNGYAVGNSNRANYDTFLGWILNGAPE